MAKLFISYRRASWPFTHRLADDLRDWLDAEIFIDFSGMDETDFERSILRNLRESDAVLLIVSPETFADRIHNDHDWVRREIREALALDKPLVMACIDGLYPPADLPEDISAVKRCEGVRFFPEYFEGGVERLATFISRATPISLRAATPSPASGAPTTPSEPPSELPTALPAAPARPSMPERTPKQRYDLATTFIEEGKYEDAIVILERLIAEGFRLRIGTIEDVLHDARELLAAEERQREVREVYDELVAFARAARTSARLDEARAHWQQFRRDYPDFTDDPAGLAEKLGVPDKPAPRVETPPKPRVIPVTDILPAPFEWCKIPQGHVTIEGQRILVPAFSMAKYPITYAQFEVFVKAPDGYRNDEWWEGLAQRDEEPFEQEWKLDKHPRENVNWYQAMAFCRWLAAKTGLPITLPTESQWQRAAQGDDGREYPWGSTFDKLKCNTNESGTRRTTPVDKFPKGASPFGVMDMAGNVWEWCLSKYTETYSHPEENDPDGDLPRVLRGGSWADDQSFARAAYRNRLNPRYWDDDGGFRVVSSAPVP